MARPVINRIPVLGVFLMVFAGFMIVSVIGTATHSSIVVSGPGGVGVGSLIAGFRGSSMDGIVLQPKRSRRRRRQPLKAAILKLLAAADKSGLAVSELAEKLKAKPISVSVWFYTSGKKIKGIAKLGAGRYSYKGELPSSEPHPASPKIPPACIVRVR